MDRFLQNLDQASAVRSLRRVETSLGSSIQLFQANNNVDDVLSAPQGYSEEIIEPRGDLALIVNHHGDQTTAFFVSSHTMARASPFWRNLLRENESNEDTDEEWKITLTTSPSALRIILNAVHGKQDQVPQELESFLLHKVAKYVMMYEVTERMGKSFWRSWFHATRRNEANTKSLVQRLSLSENVGLEDVYKDTLIKFILYTRVEFDGRVYLKKWPRHNLINDRRMSHATLEKIKKHRAGIIPRICADLASWFEHLVNDYASDACGDQARVVCGSAMLGGLHKALRYHGLGHWCTAEMWEIEEEVEDSVCEFVGLVNEIRAEAVRMLGMDPNVHGKCGPWDHIDWDVIVHEFWDELDEDL
ncbi:hypothetical protein QBC38DRAFT_515920 [Podospora fimiseda]|uniref:BTB domain-containing protein n=1 Tax=Podospora fimiseda TaxID=252190 RepID=A0AAN7BIE6_9PEZI|nr:hypothetical protein QBC38DRAFT_515920 [Podospora fimiseda]